MRTAPWPLLDALHFKPSSSLERVDAPFVNEQVCDILGRPGMRALLGGPEETGGARGSGGGDGAPRGDLRRVIGGCGGTPSSSESISEQLLDTHPGHSESESSFIESTPRQKTRVRCRNPRQMQGLLLARKTSCALSTPLKPLKPELLTSK